MTKETIFFLLSVSAVTLALSFFTAFVYTKAIPMSITLSRIVRFSGVIFPLLYVLANALSRFSNIEFIKYFYVLMSVGGGIALNLLMGAAVLVVLLISFKILGKSLPVNISYAVLALALLLSLAGIIQARTIKTISYEVSIPNLPESWEGKRAILFSDTHYGLVNNKKAGVKLFERIKKENPDMIFIAGDLFDGPEIDTTYLVSLWSEMSLTYPVFYAPGNHEEYGDYAKFIKDIKDSGINVLEDEVLAYEGVNILGLKYRGKKQEDEVEKIIENITISKDLPTIVINHPPTFMKTLDSNGFDLMLSGHTHRGQLWPGRYLTRAIYGKYHYGYQTFGNLQTITTSGIGTSGPPLRLFNTPEIVEIIFVKQN